MKKLLVSFIAMALIAITICGCGGSEDASTLDGVYETNLLGVINQYTFSKDGSYTLKNNVGGEETGTYTISGDKITLIQNSIATQYVYTLDSKTLILYEGGDTSAGIVYTKMDTPTDLSTAKVGETETEKAVEETTTAKATEAPKVEETTKAPETEATTVAEPIYLSGTYENTTSGTNRITFDKDGNFTYTQINYLGQSTLSGQYTITGDKLVLIGDSIALQYTITIMDKSILLIENGQSQGLVYNFVEGSENGAQVVSPVGAYSTLVFDNYTAPNGTTQQRQGGIFIDENNFYVVVYQKQIDNSFKYVEVDTAAWKMGDNGTSIIINTGDNQVAFSYVVGNGKPYSITMGYENRTIEFTYVEPNSGTYSDIAGLVSQYGGGSSSTEETKQSSGGSTEGTVEDLKGEGPFNVYSIDDMEGNENTYFITCTVYIGEGDPDFDEMKTYTGGIEVGKYTMMDWYGTNGWEKISVSEWIEKGGTRMLNIEFAEDGTVYNFQDGLFG